MDRKTCYTEFHTYRDHKPSVVGWYVWRLPHKNIDNLTIIFLAKYRARGVGNMQVLSPEFDHWDGYKLFLPQGSIEWAEYDGDPPKQGNEVLEVVGVKNKPCPFCGKVPKWQYSGRFIGSGPIDTDFWYMTCCHWFDGFHSRMPNPVELAEKRNDALNFMN